MQQPAPNTTTGGEHDRARQLEVLREKHAMLDAAQRLANLGSWSLHVATGTLTWSDEAHRIFGIDAREFGQLSIARFLERVHPEDRAELAALLRDASARSLRASFTFRFLSIDGRIRRIKGVGESQADQRGLVHRIVGTLMEATEQEQARRDAQLLHALDEAPSVWLWEQDAHFRFTIVTDGCRKTLGEHPIGKTRWELGTPIAGSWDEHRATLAAHQPFRGFEYRIGARVVAATGVPVFDGDGRLLGYRGTALDVTELTTLQEQTEHGQRLLQLAARLARVGAWSLELPSGRLASSAQFTSIHEGEPQSLEQVVALVHEPWRDLLRRAIGQCATNGTPFDLEVRASTAKGRPVWLRFVGEAMRACDGQIHRVEGAMQDISEARAAQQALADSEERYRLLFETSADAIIARKPQGEVLRANPAARAMFGRKPGDMAGLDPVELVAPEDRQRAAEMIAQRQRTGAVRGELTMIRADGSRFVAEMNATTFTSGDGTQLVNLLLRDVTERTLLRRRLQQLNEELAQRVKERTAELEAANAELEAFDRALAHDLRQPIAAAKSWCHALAAHLQAGRADQAAACGGQLTAATDLMGEYVDALLSLSKISHASLEMEEVDLSAMAAMLLTEMQGQQPGRRIEWTLQPGLCAVGDAMLLRLLLQNLLANAVKFTARRDVALITFMARPAADGPVVYCVRDNGAGFDMAAAHKLFASFSRLHRQSEFAGTGVGLANARRIVERHGGRIWAESVPGEGAAFMFTLGHPARR